MSRPHAAAGAVKTTIDRLASHAARLRLDIRAVIPRLLPDIERLLQSRMRPDLNVRMAPTGHIMTARLLEKITEDSAAELS